MILNLAKVKSTYLGRRESLLFSDPNVHRPSEVCTSAHIESLALMQRMISMYLTSTPNSWSTALHPLEGYPRSHMIQPWTIFSLLSRVVCYMAKSCIKLTKQVIFLHTIWIEVSLPNYVYRIYGERSIHEPT